MSDLPDTSANKSPSGLLQQGSVGESPGSFQTIFTAATITHITRIHIVNTSEGTLGEIKIAHAPIGGSGDKSSVIFVADPAVDDVWIFEAPSLGATISLARGETLSVDTNVQLGYTIYGHGSER